MVVPVWVQTVAPASCDGRLHIRELLAVDHEALAVIIHDAGKLEAERGIAAHRPGGVARQDVDFTRLQRREALLGGQRRELHLRRIAENGGGDGAAEIDVHAGPVVLLVGDREADQALAHAALHEALLAHVVQRAGTCAAVAAATLTAVPRKRDMSLFFIDIPLSLNFAAQAVPCPAVRLLSFLRRRTCPECHTSVQNNRKTSYQVKEKAPAAHAAAKSLYRWQTLAPPAWPAAQS